MISTRDALPDAIDPTEGELWRTRLSPRLKDTDIDRVVPDAERRGLTALTPDDRHWPATLRQLGAVSPIALWIAGSEQAIAPDPSRRDWDAVLELAQ